MKCLNWRLCIYQKTHSVNTLGWGVLKFWPSIFLIKACYQVLRQVFKFVLWCKQFYRIGRRIHFIKVPPLTEVFNLSFFYWSEFFHTLNWKFSSFDEHPSMKSPTWSLLHKNISSTLHFCKSFHSDSDQTINLKAKNVFFICTIWKTFLA